MPAENSTIEFLDDIQLDMDMETITLDDFELNEYGTGASSSGESSAISEIDQMNVHDLTAASMEVGSLDVGGGIGKLNLEGGGNVASGANISAGPVSISMGGGNTPASGGQSGGSGLSGKAGGGFGGGSSSGSPVPSGSEDVREMLELEREGEFAKMETIRIIERTPEPELPDEQFSRIHRDLASKNRGLEESSIFDSNDPIISIDGSELDRILYGGEGPEPRNRRVGDIQVMEESQDIQMPEPAAADMEMDNLLSTSAVDTGNFELIVEDTEESETVPSDVQYALEPTEVVRSEQEKQASQDTELDLSAFQFDLSAIPDVRETDEDEPIALSMDELNNIDVSEDNVVEFQSIEPEEAVSGGAVIAESSTIASDLSSLEVPMEEEIRMSEQSLEMMALSEENESIGHGDVERMIEINEPFPGSSDAVPGALEIEEPQDEETVEISLEELNEIGEGISRQEVSEEAYGLGEIPLDGGPEMQVAVESIEEKERVIDEKIENLSLDTKDELKTVLSYLDGLLENLPEDKIKQFAKSEYYDLYVKILDKLGI